MKKLVFALMAMLQLTAWTQVTLEQVYSTMNWEQVYLTDLGNGDYKYVYYDCMNDKFSLYHLDHSPYMLDITVAVSSVGCTKNTVGYITKELFDCEGSTIEYAILPKIPQETFYLYRTDGQLIFSQDTAWGYWCYGCLEASTEFKNINNTPDGAKLNLINGYTKQVYIYDLCGELPHDTEELSDPIPHVRVYPNPSDSSITIEWLESVHDKSTLIIFNTLAQLVKVIDLQKSQTTEVSIEGLASGTYTFSLNVKGNLAQVGRFVVE